MDPTKMTANELAHYKFVTNTQTPPTTRLRARPPLQQLSTNDIVRSANDVQIVTLKAKAKAARRKAGKSKAAELDDERAEREADEELDEELTALDRKSAATTELIQH
jgi:hypothetical protein